MRDVIDALLPLLALVAFVSGFMMVVEAHVQKDEVTKPKDTTDA